MSTDKKIDYILRTVEERDVRYLRLCFTDVLGGLKALSISPEELEEAFVEGIGFDGELGKISFCSLLLCMYACGKYKQEACC